MQAIITAVSLLCLLASVALADVTLEPGKASAQLGTGSVTEGVIATGAVTTTKIGDGAVTTSKLAADAVTTASILDGTVTTAKLSSGAGGHGDGADCASGTAPEGVNANGAVVNCTDYVDVAGDTMTGDLTLGNNADIQMAATGSNPSHSEGKLFYDNTEDAAAYYNDSSNIQVNIGRQIYFKARNESGGALAAGDPVYVTGSTGQNPTVELADASSVLTVNSVGVAAEAISNNQVGYIISQGRLDGVDTSAFNDGDILYISTTAGVLTDVAPSAPNFRLGIAVVIDAAASGTLGVRPQALAPLGFGTANQILGMNSLGLFNEYKTLNGTANQLDIANAVNSVTFSLDTSSVTLLGPSIDSGELPADGYASTYVNVGGDTMTGQLTLTGATGNVVSGASVTASAFFGDGSNLTGVATSSDFNNGGDTAGADRSIGNNDAFALGILTNGTTNIYIAAGGEVGIANSAPGEMFVVGASTLVVTEAGLVGISTTNPAALLEIIREGDDTPIRIVGYDQTPFIDMRRACGPRSAPAACGSNQIIAQIAGRGFADNDFADGSRVAIRMRTDETWSDAAQGTHIRFATTENGTTTRTDRVIVDHDGRVGIVDLSPDATLDVDGDLIVEDGITGGSTATINGNGVLSIQASSGAIQNPFNGSLQIGQNGSFPNATIGIAGVHNVSGLFVRLSTATDLSSPTFEITAAGDVGIGTSSPGSKLEINGRFRGGMRQDSNCCSVAPQRTGSWCYDSTKVDMFFSTGTAVNQWKQVVGTANCG